MCAVCIYVLVCICVIIIRIQCRSIPKANAGQNSTFMKIIMIIIIIFSWGLISTHQYYYYYLACVSRECVSAICGFICVNRFTYTVAHAIEKHNWELNISWLDCLCPHAFSHQYSEFFGMWWEFAFGLNAICQ